MQFRWLLAAALALAPVFAFAQTQPRATIQQRFDAAGAARDAEQWSAALRLYQELEADVRNPRTLALIRIRKGTVLIELGRLEEAGIAIRQGLAQLPSEEASLRLDRFQGLLTLGRLAEHDLDYPEALRQFRLAAAVEVEPADRLLAHRGIIQTEMFTDPAAALREADATLQAASTAGVGSRPVMGQLRTLRGRVLLNLARFGEARDELLRAQQLLGGMTTRVDRADLIARSDLAIAALLDRRRDDAKRYLAYTGAGRLSDGLFRLSPASVVPPCSPTIGVDDVAVVELIVSQDGTVADAKPIYASRQGPSAVEFARAAKRWTFHPDTVRNVAPLFRSVVRIEVRCSQEPETMPSPGENRSGPAAAVAPVRCDPAPQRRRFSASSGDFPNDALFWGFEGWAVGESAVARDGRVARSRIVFAYPAFVFGDSTRRIIDRTQYEPIEPRSGAPCFGGRQIVRFRLPD